MGTVHAEITIKNAADVINAMRGLTGEQDIRSITVNAIVDTGAASIVISEELRQKLGLRVKEERRAGMADGSWVNCQLTEAVDVHWKNRHWSCTAMVIKGANSVLLGAIPLEGMDLTINPKTQELTGAHGDTVELLVL